MERTAILNLAISAVLVAQGLLLVPSLQHKTLPNYAHKAADLLHRQPHVEVTKVPFRFSF